MKCPECGEKIVSSDIKLSDIVNFIDDIYPMDIFQTHPIAWVRRLLKFLDGGDCTVLIQEEKYVSRTCKSKSVHEEVRNETKNDKSKSIRGREHIKLQMNIMFIHYGRTLADLRKIIEIPFTPFIGLQIGTDGNIDFVISELHYNPETNSFRSWQKYIAISDEAGLKNAQDDIEYYRKFGWSDKEDGE